MSYQVLARVVATLAATSVISLGAVIPVGAQTESTDRA